MVFRQYRNLSTIECAQAPEFMFMLLHKKNNRFCIFLHVLVFMSPFPCYAEKPIPVEIIIDIENSHHLSKTIFGVHGEMLWSPVRYQDPELVKYYKDLGFTSIRIPGGTTANYYLSGSGNFGCMRQIPNNSKSESRIKKFQSALSKKQRTYTINDFVSFLEKANTDVTLVANVLCDKPETTQQWLQAFRKMGISVNAVEIGNELYYPEYEWAFSSSRDYINTAYQHAEKIKRVFPDVKIGLIASSFSFKSRLFPDMKKMERQHKLARALGFERASAKAQFADALVLHMYSNPAISRADKLRDHVDPYQVYTTSISHFDTRLETSINYLNSLSSNKDVWVTEWGVSFYGWLRPHEKRFEKTFYSSLFFANVVLGFALEPSITRANYHNITDLMPARSSPAADAVVETVKLFKDAVWSTDTVTHVEVLNAKEYFSKHPKYTGKASEISSALFSINAGSDLTGYVFLVNKFNTPYIIRALRDSAGRIFEPVEVTRLIAENYHNKKPGDGVKTENLVVKPSKKIIVPPYSITRIKVAVVQ